jgi:hypothetical protein
VAPRHQHEANLLSVARPVQRGDRGVLDREEVAVALDVVRQAAAKPLAGEVSCLDAIAVGLEEDGLAALVHGARMLAGRPGGRATAPARVGIGSGAAALRVRPLGARATPLATQLAMIA